MQKHNQNPINNPKNHKAPSARIKADTEKSKKFDVREYVTNEIIQLIESDGLNFSQRFSVARGLPLNISTGQGYSGINVFFYCLWLVITLTMRITNGSLLNKRRQWAARPISAQVGFRRKAL